MAKSTLQGVTFNPAKKTTPVKTKAVKGQKVNHTGGYTFTLDDLGRARRFLIMGSEGTFYQAGAKLAMENAVTIQRIAKSDQARELIDLIVEVSVGGRAAKQQPALFALALVIAESTDQATKAYGYSKLNEVARTGTTFFEFLGFLGQFQRYGMGAQKAIARWYGEKTTEQLAYQMAKYRSREGFTHRDALRLSKRVRSIKDGFDPDTIALLNWAVGAKYEFDLLPPIVKGLELAKTADTKALPALIREYGLTWEMLPSEALADKKIWDALLDGNMPLNALLRNLSRLTRLGIIGPLGGRTQEVADRLTDAQAIHKARVHPLNLLTALASYQSGRSEGGQTWTPVARIVDALDKAFYLAFDNVEATGKRWYLGLDLSASMTWPQNRTMGGLLTARDASAALALVTANIEKESYIAGFTYSAGGDWRRGTTMVDLDISPRDRLDTVVKKIQAVPAGGTDLSAPMLDALAKKIPVDVFVIYTDNEVNTGIHPFQALQKYRDGMGINAKLIVVAMTPTKFTIADPKDGGMLDIGGFDTAAPGVMAEFALS